MSKICISGAVYDSKGLSLLGMSTLAQYRLDDWLGVNAVKVDVKELGPKEYEVTIWRKYGDWYEDPQHWGQNRVFCLDEQIFLGLDYQTGTRADFEHLPGRYVIYHGLEEQVEKEYKQQARELHASRVKSLKHEAFLDKVIFTITLA